MCLHAHHQLLTVHVCSVHKLTDTGKYKVDDMIQKIATGTNYDCKDLIPILVAYNASNLDEGTTTWRLRAAIRLRLTQDAREAKAAAVTLDANVSKNVHRPLKMWAIFGGE